MMTSLLGGSKPVYAETIAGSVPEVDRVSIRVVVDSYQFAVAAGKKVGPVDIQHFGWGLNGDKPPGRTLISEFGLSMHAESRRGSETRNLLMDFGFTPEALNNNIDLLACFQEVYQYEPGTLGHRLPNDRELPLPFDKVHPINELVRVDYFLPGCPPPAEAIHRFLADLIAGREPGIDPHLLHYD